MLFCGTGHAQGLLRSTCWGLHMPHTHLFSRFFENLFGISEDFIIFSICTCLSGKQSNPCKETLFCRLSLEQLGQARMKAPGTLELWSGPSLLLLAITPQLSAPLVNTYRHSSDTVSLARLPARMSSQFSSYKSISFCLLGFCPLRPA